MNLTSLLKRPQKPITIYLFFVIMLSFVIFLRNPSPLIQADLWYEDGRIYIAETINQGFWQALYENTLQKGYSQLLKFVLAQACLVFINIFHIDFVYIPQVISILSYILHALVFCLPILLFTSQIPVKYLIANAVVNCFLVLGDFDNYLVLGRLRNISFLCIYFCFLIVLYRTLFYDRANSVLFFVIDLLILICILTQPINIFFLALIYFDLIFRIFADPWLTTRRKVISEIGHFFRKSPSLLLVSLATLAYVLFIVFSDLSETSYALTYGEGHPEYGKYSHKFYLGKFWFSQIVYPVYERLPNYLFILGGLTVILLVLILRKKMLTYSLYALVVVSAMTLYWRPGLFVVMRYNEKMKAHVYAMPSALLFLFLSFVILVYLFKAVPNIKIYRFKLENAVLLFVVAVYLTTGIHSIQRSEQGASLSFRQALCIATNYQVQTEGGLIKVPTNPEEKYMLLPEELVKCHN